MNAAFALRRAFLPLALLILLMAAVLRLNGLAAYPPGPHYDEAANVLITRSIAFGGAFLFPIVESYQGRESLYYFLAAPSLRFIADDVFALRLTSAFVNLLTLAATMALGRAMFPGKRGIIIGLAAGVLLALSFHQILMSRQAFRAVTLPLMQALALWCLWRGLRRPGSTGGFWLAAGGIFAGGALYTYMASRLFPVWLALGGLILLAVESRPQLRRRIVQGGVFFGVLIVAALPMALYALDRPDVFFQRLDEVSGGDVSVSLAESARRHAGMFFIAGDASTLRYNIPGRPYFTPLEGLLLITGMGAAGWRLIRRSGGDAPARAAYALALLAPLMVIPAVISVGGFPPSHMRSLGMVPLIFILAAVGFEAVFTPLSAYLARTTPALKTAHLVTGLVIAVTLTGGMLTGRLYADWARTPDLFDQSDADLAAAARWLSDVAGDDDVLIYVAALHREHPTFMINWRDPVTWLGTDSLFFPPPEQAGIVIFSRNTPPPARWLPLLEPGRIENVPTATGGEPAFHAFRLESSPLTDAEPLARNPYLTLLDAHTVPAPSGERAAVTLTWRVNASPPYYRLRPIIDLYDASGAVLAGGDLFLLGTDNWRPGEIMLQTMTFDVPPGTPPGEYALGITWVDRDSGAYLSYTGDDGAHAGVTADAGRVTVTRPDTFPAPDALNIAQRESHDIAPGIRLLGWNPPTANARPGEALRPLLFWQASESDETRAVSLEAVLRSERDDIRIFSGSPDYPPADWMDGELIAERMRWPLPRDLPGGEYTLLLRAGDAEIPLGEINVAGVARDFTPPPVAHESGLRLGDGLLLYGYTLDAAADALTIELVWSAMAEVNADYTVFVHLVDPASGEPVDQRDAMPRANAYPTSLWAAGEFISDAYHFDADGRDWCDYELRIGFYLTTSGARLPVSGADGLIINDYLVINFEHC